MIPDVGTILSVFSPARCVNTVVLPAPVSPIQIGANSGLAAAGALQHSFL